MLKIVLLPASLSMSLGFLGTLWLATRIARTDRRRAAWLLLRVATLLRRIAGSRLKSREESFAHFVAHAHLLQGAPWQIVRVSLESPASMAATAFQFYFADQKWEQALDAAHFWCEHAQSAIVGREAEMCSFFERFGDDLSPLGRAEIYRTIQDTELAAWEANPQGKRPGHRELCRRAMPQIWPFLRYYDSRLARIATLWMVERNLNPALKQRAFGSHRTYGIDSLGLPQFRVSDESLRALGLSETEIATLRCEAMGE